MHGINFVQSLDLKLQRFNINSRGKIARYICNQMIRERKKMTDSSSRIIKETEAIKEELQAAGDQSASHEDAVAEFRQRVNRGRVLHYSIATSAPPLDESIIVAVPIRAVYNRLFRVGIEIKGGVYLPALDVDQELVGILPGYRPIPHEKVSVYLFLCVCYILFN